MNIELLQLHDNLTALTLAPGVGGSIVNWIVTQSGQPLLRQSDSQALDSASPRRLACYPLAPWSNRIGKGGFDNPDGWLALSANAENSALPIHGSAWQQAWQVVESDASSALLRLDSQKPFSYRAEQRFTLQGGRLSIDLQVIHQDEAPAWHGLGLHPYLPRNAHTQLQAGAEHVWNIDADGLPTHVSERPVEWNFDSEKPLPQQLVDNAFTAWDGTARILQPDAGYCLDISASGCDLYLLFCPLQQPFFCFEPVSHPVNAHHMHDKPGLKLLHKGQRLSLSFSLQYRTIA